MSVLLALILLPLAPTDPLAAYEANFARAKASVRYSHRTTLASPDVIRMLSRGDDPGLDATSTEDLIGEWAFDGVVEHGDFGSPNDSFGRTRSKRASRPYVFFDVSRSENLCDGSIVANFNWSGNGNVEVRSLDYSNYRHRPRSPGPFQWSWLEFTLPATLRDRYSGIEPERLRHLHCGRLLDAEIYEKPLKDGGLDRLEILYDPSAGFLPGMVRSLYFAEGERWAAEMHLFRYQVCSSGGFVPTEYYEAQYSVADLSSKDARPDPVSLLEPSAPVSLGHFRASEFRDQTEPVGLKRLEGVSGVAPLGSPAIPFQPDGHTLTMARIKAIVGDRLDPMRVDRSAALSTTSDTPQFGGVPEEFPSWEAYSIKSGKGANWPIYLLGTPLLIYMVIVVERRWKERNHHK